MGLLDKLKSAIGGKSLAQMVAAAEHSAVIARVRTELAKESGWFYSVKVDALADWALLMT